MFSIMLYFVVFLISCVACRGYELLDDHKTKRQSGTGKFEFVISNKDLKKLFCGLFILFPSIFLSTFRGLNVGTDTANYLSIYDSIKIYSLKEYINIYGSRGYDYEIGYQQINYIAYIIKGGYNFVKFCSSFLIIFFAWRGSVYYHRKFQINSGLCMMFFYLLEFSYGLNGVRFGIALSVFFYAFQFVIEKKLLKYFFCCLFAMMFHTSMILLLLYYAINLMGNKFLHKFGKYLTAICIVFLVIFLRPIVNCLIPYIGSYASRFRFYHIDLSSNYGFGLYAVFLIFLLPLLRWEKYIKNNYQWSYILISILTFVPIRFLGYMSQWLIRLSRIPEILFCVLYCGAMKLPVNKSERLFWKIYTITLIVGYYIITVIFQNSGEVYPFIFDFTNKI